MYINDLAQEIVERNYGVPIDDQKLGILLYADDIVLIAPNKEESQDMLDILNTWCKKWRMRVNVGKSQVVHVRNHQRPVCSEPLMIDDQEMAHIQNYKYLGCWINEYANNAKTVEALTAAAGRSFGRIINMFKHLGNLKYGT